MGMELEIRLLDGTPAIKAHALGGFIGSSSPADGSLQLEWIFFFCFLRARPPFSKKKKLDLEWIESSELDHSLDGRCWCGRAEWDPPDRPKRQGTRHVTAPLAWRRAAGYDRLPRRHWKSGIPAAASCCLRPSSNTHPSLTLIHLMLTSKDYLARFIISGPSANFVIGIWFGQPTLFLIDCPTIVLHALSMSCSRVRTCCCRKRLPNNIYTSSKIISSF
jgi:hypothetical protein